MGWAGRRKADLMTITPISVSQSVSQSVQSMKGWMSGTVEMNLVETVPMYLRGSKGTGCDAQDHRTDEPNCFFFGISLFLSLPSSILC